MSRERLQMVRETEVDVLEQEAKVLNVPRKWVIKNLEKSGAEKEFEGEVENICLDTAAGALKARGISVRIRRMTSKNAPIFRWTIKQEVTNDANPNKVRRERHGSYYSSYEESLAELVAALEEFDVGDGPLVEKRRVRKRRTSYRYPADHALAGVCVDIDRLIEVTVGGKKMKRKGWFRRIRPFLEIESDDPDKIEACAKILGLTLDPHDRKMSEGELLRRLGYLPS